MSRKTVIAAVMFVIGCAMGQAMPTLVVPPVRAGTDPAKWEYSCFVAHAKDADQVATQANKLGAQGWEMSGATGVGSDYFSQMTWCFKRQLP